MPLYPARASELGPLSVVSALYVRSFPFIPLAIETSWSIVSSSRMLWRPANSCTYLSRFLGESLWKVPLWARLIMDHRDSIPFV